MGSIGALPAPALDCRKLILEGCEEVLDLGLSAKLATRVLEWFGMLVRSKLQEYGPRTLPCGTKVIQTLIVAI